MPNINSQSITYTRTDTYRFFIEPVSTPNPDNTAEMECKNGQYTFHAPRLYCNDIGQIKSLRDALVEMISLYEELQHDLPTTPAR